MNESEFPVPQPALMLCDFAEVVNGKLYVMGAGWSRIAADRPIAFALALHWKIPWDRANQEHKIRFVLVTEDGQTVNGPDDSPVVLEGAMEVGRPPGVRRGSWLDAPVAVKLPPLVLGIGGYRFEFYVNDHLEAAASFDAVGGPL